MNPADIRTDYRRSSLRRVDLHADPVAQFGQWFAQAVEAQILEPTAMSLATVDAGGQPLVRTVLLKGVEAEGFIFYTNLGSRKAEALAHNARVSLLFPWLGLERQVIVCGVVEPVSREAAQAYFASRPRESQLAAWASHQSAPVASRAALDASLEEVKARFGEDEVPLPPFWGGYRVRPESVEFWQGGASRMHDRFLYTRTPEGAWSVERLCP